MREDWRTAGPSIPDVTEEAADASEPQPDEQAPQQAEEESPEEAPQQLTPYEVADRITGREPDEEEIQRRRAEGLWDALEDGSLVENLVQNQATYEGWIEQLKERNPGIDSREAIEAVSPILEQVAEIYGRQVAMEPEVIEQAYQSVGGPEAFTPDPEVERWKSIFPPDRKHIFS